MNWFLLAMGKYADFSGRARRKEFWFFYLFYFTFTLLVAGLDVALGTFVGETGVGVFFCLFGLAMALPSNAVIVRRLHDTGRSGWWWFVGLIPTVGLLWLAVLMVLDGEAGDNHFGPDPKQRGATHPVVGSSTSHSYSGRTR